MSPGKHGPNRLRNYLATHNTIMQQLLQGGFVLSEELAIDADGAGGYFIVGCIYCRDGIYVDVSKHIAKIADAGDDVLIRTVDYRYNIAIQGRGNIFRYDSPHPDHRQDHHVHRYNVLSGDNEGEVEFIYTEDGIPTLREVICEAEDWHQAHRHLL